MSMFNEYVEQKEKLSNYIRRCRQFFTEIGDSVNAQLVDSLLQDLDKQRFNITILGSMKRGKSTLLNTLMERDNDDISPIGSLICTASILKYQDVSLLGENQQETAYVHFHNSDKTLPISLSRVRDYVTEKSNAQNAKGVSHIDVYGNFPAWSRAVTFVDSPGLNSVHAYHDDIVLRHLPTTDALVVLIAADLPMDDGDIKMLNLLKESYHKKIFFVMTKTDAVDEEEVQEIKEKIIADLEDIGFSAIKLYATSAAPIYRAICKGATGVDLIELKDIHGLSELENDLESYVRESSNELKLLAQRVQNIFMVTRELMQKYADSTHNIISEREFNIEKYKAEKRIAENECDSLREQMTSRVDDFSRNFDRKIAEHNKKIERQLPYIEANLRDMLSRNNFAESLTAAISYRKAINNMLERCLIPLNEDLINEIEQLAQTLNDDLKGDVEQFNNKVNEASVGSLVGAAAAAGVTASGAITSGYFATQAVSTTITWIEASAALTQAATQQGAWVALKGWWCGDTLAKILAGKVAVAKGAALVAASQAAIAMALSYIAYKATHLGLKKYQDWKLSDVLEQVAKEICSSHTATLSEWKTNLISNYKQLIDSTIENNKRRMEEIEEFLKNDSPEERKALQNRIEETRKLSNECASILSEIHTLAIVQ